MSWVSNLQPDLVLGGSIMSLTQDILQHYQLKGLILDVDETLVPMKSSQASEELMQWVEQTRSVASLWLVSNNLSEARIGSIARALNLPYIFGAGKPSRRKLKTAADAMNLSVEQVGMVGDRLFTDVLAGNRLGMFTILVEPMVEPTANELWSPIRDFEVWISEILGVSILGKQQNYINSDKSRQTEI
ncbi:MULTISPECIES: YqeG family HAD IIIA-type phosphatase [unclassified Coleofasciculus]|uniref:YqeG family HAD IIIA-type phosphatase n=1 Tax=unclassified Coleofasciculus TaxID=2692782 RepID=UPI001882CFE8|nr:MULTISPECIES: YqeG family HAD IIIA-type phosphatase [unclassified Coleofasciculus]MBE9127161.1 YqeG family HAD IIIA-type phosphatase [Coleofasciculus sp. LEGE 07081]MBE9150482.1 YqeG family HAD IIIA-type phosphatase [Coleofasciculus sp. LEGE 07092]